MRSNSNLIWIIPIVLLAVLTLSVGGYYAWGCFDHDRPLSSSEVQTQTSESVLITTTTEDPEFLRIRGEVETDDFYEGIWINDVYLGGKTYAEARALLYEKQMEWADQIAIKLSLNDQSWTLHASDIGFSSDWLLVLEEAWQTGRASSERDEKEQILERYAVIQQLKTTPLNLKISYGFDESLIREQISQIAKEVDREPVAARATGFDIESKKFIIKERVPGYVMDQEACLSLVLNELEAGRVMTSVSIPGEAIVDGMTAAELGANLGKVSEARTYAPARNPNRDENIRLICQKLNGLVLNAGESFSFNGYIGKRTEEKGFKPAGGIINGILEEDVFGGGICQPNTTLFQAVAMADLKIIERHPHSWPSSYTEIGLDATVSWGGADFKFQNNTKYPIAIVAWYKKPAVVAQIYGRPLEDGVSIKLISEHNGYIPVDPPIEELDPTLQPGEVVVVREEHIGQLATAYKVWYKKGKEIKREVLFKSRYRPIQGLYKVGPEPTPTPVPPTPVPPTPVPPTPVPPTPPSEPATTETTAEPTTESSTEPAPAE